MSKPIVSVHIMGGLGNQLFQIASAYAYAKKENGSLKILHITQNGDRPVYWNTILERVVPYLVSSLPPLEQWYENMATQYKEIGPLTSNGKCLNEYLQSSKYFYNDKIKQEIKDLFRPSQSLLNDVCNKYNYLIENKDRVVIMHSRQTDYIRFKETHGPLEGGYYKKAVNEMIVKVENPIFLLCGDDNNYWKEIKDDILTVYQYEHMILEGESDINTFALLQQFNNVIMANSTFIWWTTWLADAKNVIAPAKWFGPEGPQYYEDIYESHWMRI